jgi:hypothetical protein
MRLRLAIRRNCRGGRKRSVTQHGSSVLWAMPVMKEVKREAQRRKIKLLVLSTAQAIKTLKQNPNETNAILHVTC